MRPIATARTADAEAFLRVIGQRAPVHTGPGSTYREVYVAERGEIFEVVERGTRDYWFKIVLEEAPRLTTLVPDLDPALADLVHRAMAREKNDRFQTCAELAEALQTWAAAAGITLGGFETTT